MTVTESDGLVPPLPGAKAKNLVLHERADCALPGAASPLWLIGLRFIEFGKAPCDVLPGRAEDVQHDRIFVQGLYSMQDVPGNVGEFARRHEPLFAVNLHQHPALDHDGDLIVGMRMGLGPESRDRTMQCEHDVSEHDALSTHACREGRTWLSVLGDFIPSVKM
jgi:hypothetical protein